MRSTRYRKIPKKFAYFQISLPKNVIPAHLRSIASTSPLLSAHHTHSPVLLPASGGGTRLSQTCFPVAVQPHPPHESFDGSGVRQGGGARLDQREGGRGLRQPCQRKQTDADRRSVKLDESKVIGTSTITSNVCCLECDKHYYICSGVCQITISNVCTLPIVVAKKSEDEVAEEVAGAKEKSSDDSDCQEPWDEEEQRQLLLYLGWDNDFVHSM